MRWAYSTTLLTPPHAVDVVVVVADVDASLT